MDIRDKQKTSWLEKFDQHKYLYSYLLIAAYLFINNTINASSVWMEHNRSGEAQIQLWEPYVWEYSSALSTLILLPFIFALFRRMPLRFAHLGRQCFIHFLITILYSAAHVGIMVMLREGIYLLDGGNYDFSPWLREFWYEYRKDAWGYVFWLIIYQIVQSLYARIKGEASIVNAHDEANTLNNDSAHSTSPNSSPDFLLVKKLDKEFLVKVDEIEWLESAGNYVNLHKHGRIYPLRGTLNQTISRLANKGFSRIHRSFAVNLAAIDNIQYQPSGDGKVTLKSGNTLNLSRRYKDELKRQFG
ncbi:LytR/AlgR family response regulator transcription factor [Aliiglaciecola lipolytica]|uniref:Regulatory protein n=1 Tax=Aliiglaciecola lipolytica E3 TaxID=1127673 RepID=K6YHN3_9ALTE|nr:LytTR family transcriptional regulator DNA-binding domain-containing protein [Aliiglaciecola lipolytica]GAC16133.1 regulatory protein [Aliiglaciecola lipolytica E3]